VKQVFSPNTNMDTLKPQRPILLKLLLSILLPLCIIYIVILLVSYKLNRNNAEKKAEDYLSELCAHHASVLDGNLKQVMRQTESTSAAIKLIPQPDSLSLREYLRKNVQVNPFLSGLAFAFEPYRYTIEKRLYCPYLCRKEFDIIPLDVADSYDYTLQDWYINPTLKLDGYWTEPYLGGASGILNATYTYPSYKEGILYGVAAADLSLTELTKELGELKLPDAYVFLVSKKGNFIAHPKQDWILKQSLVSVSDSLAPELKNLNSIMGKSPSGILKTSSVIGKTWIVYRQIPATGWTFAAVLSEKGVLAAVHKQLLTQLGLMLLGLAIIIFFIIASAINITKPISLLSSHAHQIAQGDLDTLLPESGGRDELSALSVDFNTMTKELKEQIAQTKAMAIATARVESELSIARNIQQSLLPHVFPPFPQRKEFSLFAQMIPAREVAGDFFDFFFLDPTHLVLIIADVSGKGIPAALFMAVTRTLLKTACEANTTPSEALNKVNNVLSMDNDNCMFTTLFIGIYNVLSGQLCYANAGHLTPLLFAPDGSFTCLQSFGDPALGILEEHQYHEACTILNIDDRLVLYTDGVSEAQDADDNLYGMERFIGLLNLTLNQPFEEVQRVIQEDLFTYQNGELADDITMLFFSRKQ